MTPYSSLNIIHEAFNFSEEKLNAVYEYLKEEYGVIPQSIISKQVHEIVNKYICTEKIVQHYCESILAQVEDPRCVLVPEKIEANLKMFSLSRNATQQYPRYMYRPLFCMRHILIHVFIEFLQHLLLPQDLLQKLIFLRPAFFQFLPDPCRFLYLKTVFRQGFLFYLLFSFDLITHGIVHLSFSIINGIHLFVKFCSSISYITELFFS